MYWHWIRSTASVYDSFRRKTNCNNIHCMYVYIYIYTLLTSVHTFTIYCYIHTSQSSVLCGCIIHNEYGVHNTVGMSTCISLYAYVLDYCVFEVIFVYMDIYILLQKICYCIRECSLPKQAEFYRKILSYAVAQTKISRKK